MPDISIPWSLILLMAPILLWFVSIPGALLAGYGWYRRKKNFYAALVAAVAAAFLAPWSLLLVAGVLSELDHLSGLAVGVLALLFVAAIVGAVLWGVSRAGSRQRGGR